MHDKEVRKLTELEETHWWYAERRHLLARSLAGMPPGRALDIGAAGGGNSRVLAEAGWQVTALEYGAEGAAIGRERGLDVIRADATRLPLSRHSLISWSPMTCWSTSPITTPPSAKCAGCCGPRPPS